MVMQEIRNQLDMLKIHIDELEKWIKNANDMIFDVESNLFDIEDIVYDYKELSLKCMMLGIKEAASELNPFKECPPRQESCRCSRNNMGPGGFKQSKT